jgi:hypothetical protein
MIRRTGHRPPMTSDPSAGRTSARGGRSRARTPAQSLSNSNEQDAAHRRTGRQRFADLVARLRFTDAHGARRQYLIGAGAATAALVAAGKTRDHGARPPLTSAHARRHRRGHGSSLRALRRHKAAASGRFAVLKSEPEQFRA